MGGEASSVSFEPRWSSPLWQIAGYEAVSETEQIQIRLREALRRASDSAPESQRLTNFSETLAERRCSSSARASRTQSGRAWKKDPSQHDVPLGLSND